MAIALAGRKKVGDRIAPSQWISIRNNIVPVPDPDLPWLHLQFRRYAGCPVCNLHLRSFAKRIESIVVAGIREVVVFHSSANAMRQYQGALPFDAIADPEKQLYKSFGVEQSPASLLNPKAWGAIAAGALTTRPATIAEGGKGGLPADFLIAREGGIVACHYGIHANDQWSVEDLLTLARENSTVPSPVA